MSRVEVLDLCFDFLDQIAVCFDRLDEFLVCFDFFEQILICFNISIFFSTQQKCIHLCSNQLWFVSTFLFKIRFISTFSIVLIDIF